MAVGGERPAKEPSNSSRNPTTLFPPRHNHRANPSPIPPRTPSTPAQQRSPPSSKEPHPNPPTAGQPSTRSAPVQMKPNESPVVLGTLANTGCWRSEPGICGERGQRQPGRSGRERGARGGAITWPTSRSRLGEELRERAANWWGLCWRVLAEMRRAAGQCLGVGVRVASGWN
jgi:hypothetical protein